jgi:uncharacterized protein DUF3105
VAGTKKRRRRQTAGGRPSASSGAAPTQAPQSEPTAPPAPRGGANVARRERKELARQAREAARKRAARAAAVRRALTVTAVAIVALVVLWWFQRATAPRAIPEAAVRAAADAGCSTVQTPVSSAPGGQHLSPGQSFTYDQTPATSGSHDPSPLGFDVRVYDSPVPETRAVHNLEHAGILVYYRQDGEAALPQDVVDRLASLVNSSHNVLMAPYADLPDGTGLALTAWNKLQTCPSGVTAGQAATIANGFIEAFVCTNNAPEANQGEAC